MRKGKEEENKLNMDNAPQKQESHTQPQKSNSQKSIQEQHKAPPCVSFFGGGGGRWDGQRNPHLSLPFAAFF